MVIRKLLALFGYSAPTVAQLQDEHDGILDRLHALAGVTEVAIAHRVATVAHLTADITALSQLKGRL